MKFLNKDGVSRLWANILSTFLPKDSIVNSLDINDSSKVLSAAQGPIISTELDNLEDKKADINKIIYNDYIVFSPTQTDDVFTATIEEVSELKEGLLLLMELSFEYTFEGQITLNINNLGAKLLVRRSSYNEEGSKWGISKKISGGIYLLYYDGLHFIILNDPVVFLKSTYQDSNYRTVTDAQISTWNAKVSTTQLENAIDGIESAAAIPEDTINSIIGEVTTSAEAISV